MTTKKKLNILVMDDTHLHAEAAREQLKDHDVTVVTSYMRARREICGSKQYDVLLTDLQMPARSDNEESRGEPERLQAVGIWLVLFAAMKGIKYIGLITDVNHHADPASGALSYISNYHYGSQTRRFDEDFDWRFLQIEQSRIFMVEHNDMAYETKQWSELLGNLVRGTHQP